MGGLYLALWTCTTSERGFMMRMITFLMLTACTTSFTPSVSKGVWLESDYTATFNSACPANGVFQNSLNLTYEFGAAVGYSDSGYRYESSTMDIGAIQTYNQSLWDVCRSDNDNAEFYCSVPTLLTQYDQWKENFPVEQISQEQNCDVRYQYGYAEGVFIDDKTIRVVNYFELICTDDPESNLSVRTCSGTVSSLWTKQ